MDNLQSKGAFPLEGAISHIKTSPTQISGGLVFDTHLESFKPHFDFFSTYVPHLEILPIGVIPGMSFILIMPFHHDVSKLVH